MACGDDGDSAMDAVVRGEPTAGTWHTWVLSSGSEIQVPAPPAKDSDKAKADLKAVKDAADDRSAGVQATVAKWSGPLATKPWTELAFEFVASGPKNPPLSSRNYALLHAAMADAVVAAYHWKYEYDVKAPDGVSTLVPSSPDPSYPSEHAAMAGAASRVLAYAFPTQSALRLDEMADEAAQSRVSAGTNTPSDVEAGLALGRAVADKVIAYAKTDGVGTPWDGKRPAGIANTSRFWQPPPGSTSPPIEPSAAKWKGWVLTNNAAFRPPAPPAYTSADLRAAAVDAVDVKKNLTEEQKALAKLWEGGEGTKNPGGVTLEQTMAEIEKAAAGGDTATRWTLPQTTRGTALLAITM
ncbi:MAG TPA: phosphatase PAP2 family protein, partial [Acidimicrobiales bacterium]|nr:phosphatase PAP2 family protein [Acidimicrobiales bacterium]